MTTLYISLFIIPCFDFDRILYLSRTKACDGAEALEEFFHLRTPPLELSALVERKDK